MTKPLILLSSVVLFVVSAVCATSAMAQEPASAPSAKSAGRISPEMLSKAKKLYEIDCAFCHNANGDGKSDAATSMALKMEDWTDPKSLAGKTDAELFAIIRKGKDKMPPEDVSRAKDDEVWALIHLIRHMAGAEKPADTPAPAAPAPTAPAAPAN
jgi:cytochrome c5